MDNIICSYFLTHIKSDKHVSTLNESEWQMKTLNYPHIKEGMYKRRFGQITESKYFLENCMIGRHLKHNVFGLWCISNLSERVK